MAKTFLQSVTDQIIDRFKWSGLKDVTIVFPMHRAGLIMRSVLQQRMLADRQSAAWAPEMVILSELFDSLCPLGAEDELFTICRLYRIYNECVSMPHGDIPAQKPMEIDRFYSWGRQLLSDFTNIDQGISKTEIDSFFRNALSLSDLDTYKLDDDVRQRLEDLLYKGEAREQSLIAKSVQEHFAALWHAMPEIYHRLHNELEQAGKGYEGQRQRYVVSHWQELRQQTEGKMYCFVGFNYLLPVERQLMQLLQDEGKALFYWDYVEDFKTNSKAFAFIRQNIQTLPNALLPGKWGAPKQVRTISAASVHSEAEYAGQWLKQTYKQKGETTAVVICDEGQLESVIYGLPPIRLEGSDATEQINITKGYPLRNTRIFAEVVKQMDKSFRQHSGDPVQALQTVVDFVDAQSRAIGNQSQDAWQWHLQREALYQTHRTLKQFVVILHDSLVGELIDHPDLLQRLVRRHLEQLTLPFHGEPVTDLQIMGVLETRTLDFKHLLLLNVEEGVIPAHQPDKSFLPYYLRKAYGLQTHDERASVYAYNFFRLLNRAEDVTIVFSQSQTGMTRKAMSRFVMQMLVCPEEFTVEKYCLTESNTIQPMKTIDVVPGARWANMRKQRGKPLSLSPSAINTFYGCKRRFYIEQMLGIYGDEEHNAIFSANALGTLVHESVRYLYDSYCKEKGFPASIHPNQVEQMNTPEKREDAIRYAYGKMNEDYCKYHQGEPGIYHYDEHPFENSMVDLFIRHILERDHYDAEHLGLTIMLLEQSRSVPVGEVYVAGKLDRMDCLGKGDATVTRVVDYKTGKYDQKKMSVEAGQLRSTGRDADYVRQTLLYSYVAYASGDAKRIEPHLYFAGHDLTNTKLITHVSIGEDKPIVYDENTHKDYSELVKGMVDDILNETEFAQCLEKDCTSYCPFLLLCNRKPPKY